MPNIEAGMEIVRTIAELRAKVRELRGRGHSIGLVPTMGFLHEGHAELMRASRQRTGATIVSIFVNPTQFGANEDLASYPRDPAHDEALCREEGVSVIFAPDVPEVYPEGFQTRVVPGRLAEPLCGRFRPGHFEGVATVVGKLFNMAQPDVAFFGRKDYQQSVIVRRMARDLDMPVEIVTVPTVREPDGIALSSRNAYLSADERTRALSISRGLFSAGKLYQAGEREAERLVAAARRELDVDDLQYLELVDAETLQTCTGRIGRPAVLAVAAYVGRTRLIDNVILTDDKAPSA